MKKVSLLPKSAKKDTLSSDLLRSDFIPNTYRKSVPPGRGGSRGGGQGALAPAPAEKCPQLWQQFILPFVGVKDNSSWMAGPILTNYTLLESSRGALQFDVGPEAPPPNASP